MNESPELMTAKCPCNLCEGHLEFDALAAGQTVSCPHCGQETILFIPRGQVVMVPIIAGPPPAVPAAHLKYLEDLADARERRKTKIIGWSVGVCVACLTFYFLRTELAGVNYSGFFSVVFGLGVLALAAIVYFLPALLGRHKRNASAIFVLNIFLGWTVLGWIIALVWANMVDPEKA